jgi:hypothetical protein
MLARQALYTWAIPSTFFFIFLLYFLPRMCLIPTTHAASVDGTIGIHHYTWQMEFKWVHFMIYRLYFHKTVSLKSGKADFLDN